MPEKTEIALISSDQTMIIPKLNPPEPRTLLAVSLAMNAIERGAEGEVLAPDRYPDGEIREIMQRRRADLNEYLQPATEQQVVAEILMLFRALAPLERDDDPKLSLRSYVSDLAGVSIAGLRIACDGYRQGRLGDGKWRPRVGEIRRAAFNAVVAESVERVRLARILIARRAMVQTPEERAASVARVRAAAADFTRDRHRAT